MASRTEEVFILLKAIGAASARRGIDSVADAMGRLNSETGDHVELEKDDTVETGKNTSAKAANTGAIKQQTSATQRMIKNQQILRNNIRDITKDEMVLDKERAESFKRQQRVNNLVAQANAKIAREQERARKEEIRAIRVQEAERKRVRDQTLRAEKKFLDDQIREQRRHDAQAAKDAEKANREQERILKRFMSRRKKWRVPANAGLNSPIRVAAIGTAVAGVLDLIPFLLTGLNSVAAGGIAAANGLAPLSGMLVTLPAYMLAFGQAAIAMKLATSGMGKAIGGDDTALDKLPENARQMALSLRILKTTYTGMQRGVQNEFFKGMGDEVLLLGNALLPSVNRQLRLTARGINDAAILTSQWLRSADGLRIFNTNLKTNAVVAGNSAMALGYLFRAFLRIGSYASPMLRRLSKDTITVSKDFNSWVKSNDKEITGFFNRSYKLFKRSLGVLGDFGMGIYNIFKLSAPLSESIGRSVEKAAKNFRKWTESEDGIRAIKDYFKEMEPNLRATARLVGAFAKAIFDIGRSPNFANIADQIRTELLPSLVEIFKSIDGKFLPAFIKIIKAIEILAKSGVIDIMADVFMTFANVLLTAARIFDKLPPWTKSFIVWSIVLYGIFGKVLGSLMKIFPLVKGIGTFFKMWVVSKSALTALSAATGIGARGAVAQAAAAGGGATVVGGASKAGKAGKLAGAGKALGAVSLVVTGAMVMQPIMDWLTKQGMGSNKGSNTKKAIDTGYTAEILKDSAGKPLVGGLGYKDITNLDDALKKLNSNNVFTKFNNWMARFNGHAGPVDKLKGAFAGLDTQLSKIPAAKAAASFKQVYDAAVRQKIPMDKLIAMFPNYTAKLSASGVTGAIMGSKFYTAAQKAEIMSGRLNGVPLPAGKARDAMLQADLKAKGLAYQAGQAGSKVGTLSVNLGKVPKPAYSVRDALAAAADKAKLLATHVKSANGWINNLNVAKLGRAATASGKIAVPLGVNRFAGGMVGSGQLAITGEIGPEATITRGGQIGMVGIHGPEYFKPSTETAVIPSSATTNPMSGNYGLAPDWAKSAFQTAMGGASTKVKDAVPQNQVGKNDTMATPPTIMVTGNTFTETVDVEAALNSAYKKMIREQEERR